MLLQGQLLIVPIARPSEVIMETVIKVTVTFKLRSGDHDPIIGLTDGTIHEFSLRDLSNYASSPPCHIYIVEIMKAQEFL